MQKIKSFDQFNEEINLKQAALAALTAIGGSQDATATNWPWSPKTHTAHVKTKSDVEAARLQSRGWTLDSTSADTVWKAILETNPEALVYRSEIRFDDEQFFQSGQWHLNSDMIDSLNLELDRIAQENGVIFAVEIESSTDKQPLSKKLQSELKQNGFTPDNSGLSKARATEIKKHLINTGVNDTIIEFDLKFEKGEKTIDSSARYVIVRIAYWANEAFLEPQVAKLIPEITTTHYLSKEFKNTSQKKRRHKKSRFNKSQRPIGFLKKKHACFEF